MKKKKKKKKNWGGCERALPQKLRGGEGRAGGSRVFGGEIFAELKRKWTTLKNIWTDGGGRSPGGVRGAERKPGKEGGEIGAKFRNLIENGDAKGFGGKEGQTFEGTTGRGRFGGARGVSLVI